MKKVFITIFCFFVFVLKCFAESCGQWATMPVPVYIPQIGNISLYMKQSFLEWQKYSLGRLRFRFVENPSDAKILVRFKEFVTNCGSEHAVGCTHYLGATPKGNFQKVVITIGYKEYILNEVSSGKFVKQKVTRSKEHIYGCMLHEVGHALGLEHSNNPKSIMYPYDLQSMQYLTKDDIMLIQKIYR